MMVILCNSFQEVQDSYDIFISYLEENEPGSIRETYDSSYCVELEDDMRYIFIDYRFKQLFLKMDNIDIDTLDVDSFFDGLWDYYYTMIGGY